MILRSILLQHFRNYTQEKFDFSDTLTLVIGVNTAGKTNLAEAIYLLATGKSFKAGNDTFMIAFGQDVARVQGLLVEGEEKIKEEVVIASAVATGGRFSKRFLLNGVSKSRNSLQGLVPIVLFRPEELEIIIDGPSLRREFLDEVLEQADKDYRVAKTTYDRSLRQRNALLRAVQETGKRNQEQFDYWDNLLIESGQIITAKREEFLEFVNDAHHDIFSLQASYDKSIISVDRLKQYKEAEVGAGVTLVGPHRDDFFVTHSTRFAHSGQVQTEEKDIRHFGSRGQQRLAVLQLKMLQIRYLQQIFGVLPLLILDDIFSELDSSHIQLVLDKVKGCQIVLTTTHKEFVPDLLAKSASVIELSKDDK